MTDVTLLVLGILALLVIPAVIVGKKAKEAQEKEKRNKWHLIGNKETEERKRKINLFLNTYCEC